MKLLAIYLMLISFFPVGKVYSQPAEGIEVARFGRGQAIQIQWHPDGTRFFVSTFANELWVYDAESLQVMDTIENVRYFRFIEGTNYLRTWDAENKSVIRSLAALDDVLLTSTSFYGVSPDGHWITVRTPQNTFEILDAETFKPVIRDIPAASRFVYWSPESGRFAVAGPDDVNVWDMETSEVVAGFRPAYPSERINWQWSSDGTRLLQSTEDGSVEIWDVETSQDLLTLDGTIVRSQDYYGTTAHWLADGTRFMQCLHGNDADWMPCSVYDSVTGELIAEYHGNPAFAVSPNGELIAWGAVGLLDASSGELLQPFDQLVNWGGQSLFWSPDSREVAFSNRDVPRLAIYNVEQQEIRLDLKGHTGRKGVTNVSWSPDGQRILSLDGAGLILMWDAVDGRMVHRIEEHIVRRVSGQTFESSAFDSSNKRLLVASDSGKIEIWNLETQALQREIRGAGVGLYQIGWEPGGALIATVDQALLSCAACAGNPDSLRVSDSNSQYGSVLPHGLPSDYLYWSPQGGKLGLTDERNVAVVNIEQGTAVLRPSFYAGYSASMQWSMDGTKIAVHAVSGSHGSHTVIVLEAATLDALSPFLQYNSWYSQGVFGWHSSGDYAYATVSQCDDPSSDRERCPAEIRFISDEVSFSSESIGGPYISDVDPTLIFGDYRQPYFYWSPDGQKLATIDGGRLQVWNVEPDAVLLLFSHEILPHTSRYGSPANPWRADGRYLAINTKDGGTVIDAGNGTDVLTIDAAYSPWWSEQTLRVCIPTAEGRCLERQEWDVETGILLASDGDIPALRSTDGRYAVYERGGMVIVYDMQPE